MRVGQLLLKFPQHLGEAGRRHSLEGSPHVRLQDVGVFPMELLQGLKFVRREGREAPFVAQQPSDHLAQAGVGQPPMRHGAVEVDAILTRGLLLLVGLDLQSAQVGRFLQLGGRGRGRDRFVRAALPLITRRHSQIDALFAPKLHLLRWARAVRERIVRDPDP